MLKKLSFALFDTGETILGALVFSTFFPLYITRHIETHTYSFLYGFSFLLSFLVALQLGKIADRRSLRKPFFVIFGLMVSVLCALVGLSQDEPFLALFFFLLLALAHQQAFVFYNSMLLNFDGRGFASGLGVSLGYIGSAFALIFLARHLKEPEVYFVVAVLFLLFLTPAVVFLENPRQRAEVNLKEVLRDKRFLMLIISILTVTEVANTLIAMMGIYLREVFSLESTDIYRVIGLSATGGILGGIFWGKVADAFGVKRVFPAGFLLWTVFLLTLPLITHSLVLAWGFFAGFSLSHLWTTSRVLILSEFPEGEASVRLSFLSLTERIASTTGLTVWGLLLLLTGNNYRLSSALMAVFPLIGLGLFWYVRRRRLI